MENNNNTYPRLILGLDVSTACIGVSIVKDDGVNRPEIMYLSHKTPAIPRKIKGLEALFLKKQIFENEFIKEIKDKFQITDVIIEEPLLSSNNINTVATLLRFNGLVSESIYSNLGIVPSFISSYDARTYSFPELVSLRKYNKRGEEYPLSHIKNAIKNNKIVLFGSYPFDIDKKTVMMDKVNEMYADSGIEWIIGKIGEIKKENFDACDSLICVLAYININRYGISEPKIVSSEIKTNEHETIIDYSTQIWGKTYKKQIILSNER